MANFVLGISGASGAIYGLRLLTALCRGGHTPQVIISATARAILRAEAGVDVGTGTQSATRALHTHVGMETGITVHSERNQHAPIASGSVASDGMVVAPCSMKTLSAIRHGYADTLLTRAADVHIKERRPLILVPRETPFSTIHLENLLALSRLPNVCILPAMPGFYTHPESVEDLVDFVVARILDQLGVHADWHPRWTGVETGEKT